MLAHDDQIDISNKVLTRRSISRPLQTGDWIRTFAQVQTKAQRKTWR